MSVPLRATEVGLGVLSGASWLIGCVRRADAIAGTAAKVIEAGVRRGDLYNINMTRKTSCPVHWDHR